MASAGHRFGRAWRARAAQWAGLVVSMGWAATATPASDAPPPVRSDTHWAFEPPQRHAPPAVADAAWPSQPVDPFVLHRIEAAGLSPNPPASPHHLARRLSFDLTGLPPSPAETAAFEAAWGEDQDAAVSAAVDRLLASPQAGARWARVWLDVARYAEDQAHIVGANNELFYPNAYLYRDWVIGALNRDLPYDSFIKLQLAADLIEPDAPEAHVALGFIGLGPKYYRRSDPTVMADEWEDRVDTVTRGLLGLTVSCARCHDHKADPIPTEDYYALAGVFASSAMFNRPLDGDRETEKDGQAKSPADAAHIIRERDTPQNLKVHLRGDPSTLGPEVPRRFLAVLARGEDEAPFSSGSGRAELAEAIANRDNPLTARVFVNRVWAEMFGRPLVATPSNFGTLGTPPTHPELLDDLAVRFMEQGWSPKWLLRELALSSTYRQSGELTQAKHNRDPSNTLLSRMSRRRLDVEMWRDALFAAAGTLDLAVGGPSFQASDPEANRRAIYAESSRLKVDPMLALFDFPDPNLHSPGRHKSTTPLQKLFALNNPLVATQAKAFAERLHREAPDDDPSRVRLAYQIAYARQPNDEEETLALGFLSAAGEDDPWPQLAQAILASNELLYLD